MLWALFVALFLVAPALCLWLSLDFRAHFNKPRREAGEKTVVGWLLVSLFGFLSCLPDYAHFRVTSDGKRKNWVEFWTVAWAISHPVLLFILVEKDWRFIIVPLIRLFDLFANLTRLLVLQTPVWNKGRALVLLLVQYTEVVTIFACFYFALPLALGREIFCSNGVGLSLSPAKALYFSLVTASTVGYGDIVPCLSSFDLPFFERPSTVIPIQNLCFLVVTAVVLSHVYSGGQERDEAGPRADGLRG